MLPRFLILLPFLFAGVACAEPLAVKTESLGAWTYLYPLNLYPGGDSEHHRDISTPTVLPFGANRERVAVILPGSITVAEFKDASFDDLHLPDEWTPYSLAADRTGKLFCLVQRAERLLSTHGEWKKRWVIGLGAQGWEAPISIPWEGCDRIEFDSTDRLWALGTAPQVGFFANEKWTTYEYSNDRQLQFLPMRMAEQTPGRVTIFAWSPWPGPSTGISRLKGTLTYGDDRFTRELKADTTALCTAENRRYAEPLDQPGFDRAHGYVCHGAALNVGYRGPVTALHTGNHFFVSFGNEGFAWVQANALADTPALKSDEWESLDDITVPPTLDAAGNLWVGRGKQLRKISATEEQIAGGQLDAPGDMATIDFDPLGRPWLMRWHDDGPITTCDNGTLRNYRDLPTALIGERATLATGYIFPFALKTKSGTLAFGGGYFDEFTIIDAKGVHRFTDRQIAPHHDVPKAGHGYNPFRGGEPAMDKAGSIYTRIDGSLYRYDPAHRGWSPIAKDQEQPAPPPPLSAPFNDRAGPLGAKITLRDGSEIVFQGFHFFVRTAQGQRQLETGLNPLAFYPFWSGWYRSPGLTTPVMDPTGRLWISSLGPYAGNRQWFRLRTPWDLRK